MSKEYSKLDHFLIRAKDIGFLLGIIWAIFIWLSGWQGIPGRVEAQEVQAAITEKWKSDADKSFATIAESMRTMKEQQTEMRHDIKTLLQRGNR